MNYPEGYCSPQFVLFNVQKGNLKEHISYYFDTLGQYAVDLEIQLREFSKSLSGCAYTWYTNLKAGSIYSWNEMASKFYQKYFQTKD